MATAKMLEQLTEGYQQALAGPSADLGEKPDCVRLIMRKAVKRTWGQLAKSDWRIRGPLFPWENHSGPYPLARGSKSSNSFRPNRCDDSQLRCVIAKIAPAELLDAVYWVKGCSSLGRLRVAVLLGVGNDLDEEGAFVSWIYKEAIPAVAPHGSSADIPEDDAVRVVSGACHLSPALGKRMLAARFSIAPWSYASYCRRISKSRSTD